jgi:Calponin homology (CH) domain
LNAIQPEIIPSAQIKLHPKNAFEKIENHNLAIQAAKKLGCSTVNIGPEDLLQGKVLFLFCLLISVYVIPIYLATIGFGTSVANH